MNDSKKTKQQLINELIDLRKQIAAIRESSQVSITSGKLVQLAPQIVENSFYSIWVCRDSSKNFEILFWNKGAEEIYNTPRDIAIGLNFVETFVSGIEKVTSATQIDEIIHDGRVFKNFLAVDHTPDGQNRLMLIDNFRIWDEVSNEYVQVEMALHTTETDLLDSSDNLKAIRKFELEKIRELEIEKQLLGKLNAVVAEKQDLLTRANIALDLAHSMNNLAGPIKTWASLIRDRLFLSDPRDEQINGFLLKIERETNRLLDEAEQLSQPAEAVTINLKLLIEAMASNLILTYPEIQVKVIASSDLKNIFAVQSQISTAVWNVIFNSVEAITRSRVGGLITVDLSNTRTTEKPMVKVLIADDGPGIPDDVKERIFDISYSTKDNGGINGYGLWRSKNIIVDILGGEISFISTIGEGTEFSILLPLNSMGNLY